MKKLLYLSLILLMGNGCKDAYPKEKVSSSGKVKFIYIEPNKENIYKGDEVNSILDIFYRDTTVMWASYKTIQAYLVKDTLKISFKSEQLNFGYDSVISRPKQTLFFRGNIADTITFY